MMPFSAVDSPIPERTTALLKEGIAPAMPSFRNPQFSLTLDGSTVKPFPNSPVALATGGFFYCLFSTRPLYGQPANQHGFLNHSQFGGISHG